MTRTGRCLCGAVRYRVEGPLRAPVACHCEQCRRSSGHYVAAVSCTEADLAVEGGAAINWFASSPGFRRGFCGHCGSQLFWQRLQSDSVSIFAGSLDDTTGLRLSGHVHTASKGVYYDIDDELPHHEGAAPELTRPEENR